MNDLKQEVSKEWGNPIWLQSKFVMEYTSAVAISGSIMTLIDKATAQEKKKCVKILDNLKHSSDCTGDGCPAPFYRNSLLRLAIREIES